MLTIPIARDDAGRRLDRVLAVRMPHLSRTAVKALFATSRVVVVQGDQRRIAAKGDVAAPNTHLEVHITDEALAEGALPDSALHLTIALERPDLVIVDKAAGIASAPLKPGERGTVASALLARYPEMEGIGHSPREPGLCHRLDNGTSGLLLAARTREAFEELFAALDRGALDKRYLLVCPAAPLQPSGHIDLPLLATKRRVRPAPGHPRARPAVTSYTVLRTHAALALVEAQVSRATRHQIRAHFAALGAPLVGDPLYGGDAGRLPHRHALHATRIHYAGGKKVPPFDVSSQLPLELAALVP